MVDFNSRVGGSIPLVWSYFAEFQPKDKRGGVLSVLATFWMGGNVVVAGLAWIIIPHTMTWPSWRLFTLICSVPSLLTGLTFIILPESPKFLLTQGKHDQALTILKNIYSSNTGSDMETFSVDTLEMEEETSSVDDEKKSFLQVATKVSKLKKFNKIN